MDLQREADRIWEAAKTDEGRAAAKEIEERLMNDPGTLPRDLGETELWEAVNAAYIARRFFGKSRSWFGHKLRHDLVNGKRSDFTPSERERLKQAIETLATELQAFADSI